MQLLRHAAFKASAGHLGIDKICTAHCKRECPIGQQDFTSVPCGPSGFSRCKLLTEQLRCDNPVMQQAAPIGKPPREAGLRPERPWV